MKHSKRGLPVCDVCDKEFRFDLDEPFATCGCPGCTEWGHQANGDHYRRIERKIRVQETNDRVALLNARARTDRDGPPGELLTKKE